MSKTLNQHELFWLARHAYNTLNPIVAELRSLEPSVSLHIETNFDNSRVSKPTSLTIAVHWTREGLAAYVISLITQHEIEYIAEKLRSHINELKEEVAA